VDAQPKLDTPQKTLVFCTAHVDDETVWDGRYRRWFDAIAASGLRHDTALMVDDGSPVLPDWQDVALLREGESLATATPRVLYHFAENLGRRAIFDFPGWHRSFTFAAEFAEANGFTKVIHLESDAFVVSQRLRDHIDGIDQGWTAFWCPSHGFPEITLQVMAGVGLAAYRDFCASVPHAALVGRPYEEQIPFSHIERGFTGDRYGERLPYVPIEADFVAQAREADASYYWWVPPGTFDRPGNGRDARSLARHNEILRYDRGRLQAMIYGLQAEVADLRGAAADRDARRPAARLRRAAGKLCRRIGLP
jgi:hypothetical protein